MCSLATKTSAATTAGHAAACMIAASCLAAACGSSIDGDSASIAARRQAVPQRIDAPSSSPPHASHQAALPDKPCEADGRVLVCSLPRLHAQALNAGWIALRYQWRRNGVDIPGANRAWYVPGTSDPADAGASYTVEITDGAGRTLGSAGVPAGAGAGTRLSRR